MADPRRLSLADQLLANAMAAILVPVVHDAARQAMLIEVLREALPAASPDHPRVAPLIAAARGLLDAGGDAAVMAGARLSAAQPAADFFMARAGAALDALRATKAEGQDG